jgi:hypothetical protein
MNEVQRRLLVKAVKRNLPIITSNYDPMTEDEIKQKVAKLFEAYPMTGPGGLRRYIGELDSEYFCKAYMPDLFNKDFGDHTRQILATADDVISSNAQENLLIVAPREHGKSTTSSVAVPCRAILYEKKWFVFFISANADTSANFLEKCKKVLESPEVTEDFGTQKGRKWNADEICTAGGRWIACAGWKSGIRGINKDTRPDLIILDDLEDKQTMESDSMRQKLETCFNDEIGRLGYHKTDMFYIGTLLSEDSLLARKMKDPSWKLLFFQCVKSFPEQEHEKLWEEWREIYRDIANENRFDDAYNFYLEHKEEMLKGVEVLWPGRFPDDEMKYKGAYYNIMLNREKFGEDSFWKEDQNEPRSSSDRPFKQLRYWQDVYEDVPRIDKIKLAIDPAEGKGKDSTAYTMGGKINGAVAVLEGQLKNHKLDAIMKHVKWFIETYPEIDEIILEENTYKEDGTEQLRKYLVDNNAYRKVTGHRATDNKYNRILQMEPDINNGMVLFNKLNVEYNNQVLSFAIKCKNDDAPDSLQKLWKCLKIPDYKIW